MKLLFQIYPLQFKKLIDSNLDLNIHIDFLLSPKLWKFIPFYIINHISMKILIDIYFSIHIILNILKKIIAIKTHINVLPLIIPILMNKIYLSSI